MIGYTPLERDRTLFAKQAHQKGNRPSMLTPM